MVAKTKSPKAKAATVDAEPAFLELPIAKIDAHPSNPRTEFDKGELDELASSLKEHGLLQPIVVRELASGRYQVIAGGRRLLAAKAANLKTVPATIRNVTEDEAFSLALVENMVRSDLNPVDTARAVARLCAPTDQGGMAMSHVAVGAALSRDASWVRHQIQLLALPDCWLKRVASGELNVGMSKALLPYAQQPSTLARIEDDMLENPWSWRTADDFVRNAKLLADDAPATTPAPKELKPMRATPGTGERKRPSRAEEFRVKRASQSTSQTAPDTATAEASETEEVGAIQIDRSAPSETIASPVTPSTVDVALIIEWIEQLEDLADLARVATAIENRRASIKRAARAAR